MITSSVDGGAGGKIRTPCGVPGGPITGLDVGFGLDVVGPTGLGVVGLDPQVLQ